MFRRLWRHTIWHPAAIDPAEWEYRWTKRVWVPAFDVLVILAGATASVFGSPLLTQLFGDEAVDYLGVTLAAAATAALFGVAFPRLWRVEIAGLLAMVGLLGAYATAVLLVSVYDTTRGFAALIVALTLPLPLARLTLLGEEIKERREPHA